ncbi:hypothetical protein [uncultured Bradyrhizobium sp.]
MNSALENAQGARLEVNVDYSRMQKLGNRSDHRIYYTEVSK